ncbi:MAG: hypothetical protein H6605_03735 [Flavobacteriales bacterium]|nr:hypothetical protein [Flavobacteriales bacterium]
MDVGAQAGFDFEAGGLAVRLEGSLMTIDLASANYEQIESDYGPKTFDFDYVGEDGYAHISQYAGASYYGGAEYEHSFDGSVTGGGYKNENHSLTVNAVIVKYQVKKQQLVAMKHDLGFSIKGRLALILGIEGEISFGVRDKPKKRKK